MEPLNSCWSSINAPPRAVLDIDHLGTWTFRSDMTYRQFCWEKVGSGSAFSKSGNPSARRTERAGHYMERNLSDMSQKEPWSEKSNLLKSP